MTDNEIIKALECCDTREWCTHCPLKDNDRCRDVLSAQSVELINRQKAELERLENRKLKDGELTLISNTSVKEFKAEAIKGFAERLKDVFITIDGIFECWEVEEHIDNLVKEMTEE